MPYKNREKQLAYMRHYQDKLKEKAAKVEEARIAERYLAEHLKIQTISDFQSYVLAKDGKNRDDQMVINVSLWLLEKPSLKEKKRKEMPSFLESVVDEVARAFPLVGSENREVIEYLVHRNYERAQRSPEEVESSTWMSRRAFVSRELTQIREKFEEAKGWLAVYAGDVPDKRELFDAGRIKHFAECMRILKDKGVSFYVAREVTGKRFLDSGEFWDKEWRMPGPESMARSRYALGRKFWVEAEKAYINVDWIREWMETDEKLKEIEELNLAEAKMTYEVVNASNIYDKIAYLSIKQNLSDDEIMERLKEVGATKVIDPTYLRHKLVGLRKDVQKEYEFVLDQKILKGLIEGLKDDDIVKEVLNNYVVIEDELRTRIKLLKKHIRREFDEAEQKLWTHFSLIRHRIKVMV